MSEKIESTNTFEPGKSISITDIIQASQTKIEEKKEKKKEDSDLPPELAWTEKPSFSKSGFRVNLENNDGAGYIGTIFLGSEEQPAKVLFDTGSDYLAVTTDLCLDPKLGKEDEDVPVFNATSLQYEHSGKDLRKCKSTAFASKKSQSMKMLNETEKLDYGSAKLEGKLMTDRACLD